MPIISIIMPARNEAQNIRNILKALQPLRTQGHEIILIDGGSQDDTLTQARPWVDLALSCALPSRARQMNQGAAQARGEILLFLHADTTLPQHADEYIITALNTTDKLWGRFDVRFTGHAWLLKMVASTMNLRSRLSSIATGDQALFVSHKLFEEIGGFPDIPLMEDIALSKQLKKIAHPACLKHKVTTSSRRWETNGIIRTIFKMWAFRLAYFLGIQPQTLVKYYYSESSQ